MKIDINHVSKLFSEHWQKRMANLDPPDTDEETDMHFTFLRALTEIHPDIVNSIRSEFAHPSLKDAAGRKKRLDVYVKGRLAVEEKWNRNLSRYGAGTGSDTLSPSKVCRQLVDFYRLSLINEADCEKYAVLLAETSQFKSIKEFFESLGLPISEGTRKSIEHDPHPCKTSDGYFVPCEIQCVRLLTVECDPPVRNHVLCVWKVVSSS
jgi:hypothetical protein